MSPELKQTLEIIIAGMSLLICLVLLISFAILSNKLRELRKEVRNKNNHIRLCDMGFQFLNNTIDKLNSKLKQYEFVMDISDDISAELVKENEELLYKVDLLKSKLNHKKRPCKCKK